MRGVGVLLFSLSQAGLWSPAKKRAFYIDECVCFFSCSQYEQAEEI